MAQDKNTNIVNIYSEIVIYQNDDGGMKIDATLEDSIGNIIFTYDGVNYEQKVSLEMAMPVTEIHLLLPS